MLHKRGTTGRARLGLSIHANVKLHRLLKCGEQPVTNWVGLDAASVRQKQSEYFWIRRKSVDGS